MGEVPGRKAPEITGSDDASNLDFAGLRISERGHRSHVTSRSKELVVAAIEIGRTYSGFAFSFHDEPMVIRCKVFSPNQLLTLKVPSCVLIRPDGITVHSYGYQALDKYAELSEDDKHINWYFFRVGPGSHINERSKLKDESGKTLPANTVMSSLIKCLKDDATNEIGRAITGKFNTDGIRWMLVVPLSSTDTYKQLIHGSAKDAGISETKITMIPEPEAAFNYCMSLPTEKGGGLDFIAENMYMVLDAGGITVDITVYEYVGNGKVKEVYRADCPWSGERVDDAFVDFVSGIAGFAAFSKFKEQHMHDYEDFITEWEIKKRNAKPGQEPTNITFRIPTILETLVRETKHCSLKDASDNSRFRDEITHWGGDRLRVSAKIVKGFFRPVVDNITEFVSGILKKPINRGVETILMVGGFSGSQILQEAMRNRFSNLKFIVPDDIAILKGAVMYGHI